MSGKYQQFDDDDGRVIADMSDVERQPMLMPRLGQTGKARRDFSDSSAGSSDGQESYGYGAVHGSHASGHETVNLDADERRAMIGGAVSAGLLVVGVIAAAFAALILLILKVWG